jgi:hypothetical protein
MNSLICTKIKIVIKLLYKSSFSVRERKGEREREREREMNLHQMVKITYIS